MSDLNLLIQSSNFQKSFILLILVHQFTPHFLLKVAYLLFSYGIMRMLYTSFIVSQVNFVIYLHTVPNYIKRLHKLQNETFCILNYNMSLSRLTGSGFMPINLSEMKKNYWQQRQQRQGSTYGTLGKCSFLNVCISRYRFSSFL